jgi:tRNA G18 (ribose-2'-O)-methylase SpoU
MLQKSEFTLTAKELRHLTEEQKSSALNQPKNNIHIVLDNVVDAYNVGSAFRIADSINAKKVWILGENIVTPYDRQVQKSSMYTCQLVEWETNSNFDFIHENFSTGFFIAVEKLREKDDFEFKIQNCKNISGILQHLNVPIFIIVGSESFGISQEILNKVDTIVEIPMLGVNNSMNVINALTLICYSITGLI